MWQFGAFAKPSALLDGLVVERGSSNHVVGAQVSQKRGWMTGAL